MGRKLLCAGLAGIAAMSSQPLAAAAPAAANSDSGDTAWILAASALVLLMTLPGLALFYGGLVRAKNTLSVLLQCGAVAAIASLIWVIAGYTIAFGPVSDGWIGGGAQWLLSGTFDTTQSMMLLAKHP